jgi:hypothetical protein
MTILPGSRLPRMRLACMPPGYHGHESAVTVRRSDQNVRLSEANTRVGNTITLCATSKLAETYSRSFYPTAESDREAQRTKLLAGATFADGSNTRHRAKHG